MKRTLAGKTAMTMSAVVIITILFTAAVVEGADFRHEETISKSISVEDAKRLVIESLSGDITVTGEEGRETIELKIIKTVSISIYCSWVNL